MKQKIEIDKKKEALLSQGFFHADHGKFSTYASFTFIARGPF